MYRPGRHFLQIPGPTNVPDRVLRAIDAPTIDHRGPDFAQLGLEVLDGLRSVCRTEGHVVVYPASGTGAWEAALVNTLSPGDKVIASETGHFATLWRAMATKLGLDVVWLEGDWRHGADPERIADALEPDTRAVMVVHNETSTGVTSRIADVRAAMGDHDALLLVDTISSLASIDYRHDEWGVDVTVGGSQKGLMLPAGLSLNAVSAKAVEASRTAGCRARIGTGRRSSRPTRPATGPTRRPRTCSTGCARRSTCCSRKRAWRTSSPATPATPRPPAPPLDGWGLEVLALDEREFSGSLTAVLLDGSDELRRVILERFDMSLGAGLGKLADQVFRIGHLGDFNDLMLAGTLSGVQMGLHIAGHDVGDGVGAALEQLAR